MPVLIGDGISFFQGLEKDVALHLLEAKAYKKLAGMVVDIYKLQRGYDRKAPVAWMLIHSLIIGSGLYFLGGA